MEERDIKAGFPDRSDQLLLVDSLNEQAWRLRYTDLSSSRRDASKALELSKQMTYLRGQAYARLNLAAGHFLRSQNKDALEFCFKAMEYFHEHTSETGYAATLTYIGNIYESFGGYESALKHCQRAYQAAADMDYKEGMGESQSVLGLIYSRLSDHDRALEAYEEGLRIREELGDVMAVASSMNRIARVYTQKKQYDKALDHYRKSLKIREINDPEGAIAWTYLGMASTYEVMGNVPMAKDFYGRILERTAHPLDDRCKMQATLGLGRTLITQNLGAEALACFEDALELANQLEAKPLQVESHNALADYYELAGDYEKALFHYKKYRSIREEILNDETRNRLNNQQIAYAVEKSEKEKEIFQLRNVELKSAYDEIHSKSKAITESINYASRIQTALLPQHENFEKLFTDHFILYLPKDVVSGDFYWSALMGKKMLFAAADCTGHGVPGALMSMLGISFLNEIVIERKHTVPGEILDILRGEVIKAMKQTGRGDEQKEGMDIALCSYEPETGNLEYAGAYNPLYMIRGETLEEFKADRMPISYLDGTAEPFITNSITLQKGDQLYLFSDGYADQFGGPRRKKFKYHRLKEFLLKIRKESMEKQKLLLHDHFFSWRGDVDQYDDVVFLGIRI